MLLFLVALDARARDLSVLSEETKAETGAVVMTRAEAEELGFSGLPQVDPSVEMRIVACREQDARRLEHALNINDAVLGIEVVHLDD